MLFGRADVAGSVGDDWPSERVVGVGLEIGADKPSKRVAP